MVAIFAVPIFFICFRECLETSLIVSILLAFLKSTLGHDEASLSTYRKLRKQVWVGTGLGFLLCLIVGSAFVGMFYALKKNAWSTTELLWEGILSLIAALIITVMGAALLRVSKIQEKWKVKISRTLETKNARNASASRQSRLKWWMEKYAMVMLPFITVLREGLEAVVFISGVGASQSATAIPLPAITGLAAGGIVGYLIYRGAQSTKIQIALTVSTCFLYLVGAGLMSRSIGFFEQYVYNKLVGGDAGERGAGPGSYDSRYAVWHVNCCNPELSGGWGIFNSLFGWNNTATYGTVIVYNVYWLMVIAGFLTMRYKEKRGHKSTSTEPEMRERVVSEEVDAQRSSETTGGSGFSDKNVDIVAVSPIHGIKR